MVEEIQKRLAALLDQGEQLERVAQQLRDVPSRIYMPWESAAEAMGWLVSTANIIHVVTGGRGPYCEQMTRIREHKDLDTGVPRICVHQACGTLRAAFYDWRAGLLRKIEYLVAAENFDGFLDHASDYHKAGKPVEAAVLVSAVLEDTVKKIIERHGLDQSGTLDPKIGRLVEAAVFTQPERKRVKSFADVRNKAYHAEWDKLDLRDVGKTIEGVRELIRDHLER